MYLFLDKHHCIEINNNFEKNIVHFSFLLLNMIKIFDYKR